MTKQLLFLTLTGLLTCNLQLNCMENNNPDPNLVTPQVEQLATDPSVRLGTLNALYDTQAHIPNALIDQCIELTETTKNSHPEIHANAAGLAFNCLSRQFAQTPGPIQPPFFLSCNDLRQSTLEHPIFTAELNRLVAMAINRNIPGKSVAARKLFN